MRRGLSSAISLSCCSGDGGQLECLNFLSKCVRARLAQMLSHIPCKAGWVGVFVLLPAEHLILVCCSEKTREEGGGGEGQGVLI